MGRQFSISSLMREDEEKRWRDGPLPPLGPHGRANPRGSRRAVGPGLLAWDRGWGLPSDGPGPAARGAPSGELAPTATSWSDLQGAGTSPYPGSRPKGQSSPTGAGAAKASSYCS